MAINAPILETVLNVARKLGPGQHRMLSLGYPDMLVTEAQLQAICGPDILKRITFREDSGAILRWHNLSGVSLLPDTQGLLKALNLDADFVDIAPSRGCEIMMDLNQPAAADMHDAYDLIYDGGTMEHCFNVGQVMRNIHAMTRPGGYIVHLNPVNYFNHGFFNFNPTFYHDFYTQSGNRIVSEFQVLFGPVLESKIGTVHPTQGGAVLPPKSVLLVVAQKTSTAEPGWPMQTKYLKNPSLSA